jgi:DNA polymerase-3 subunit epsilon
MGIEKTKGACFSYSLGRCKGACVGKESPELYNRRFEIALEHTKIANWPFKGAVSLPVNEEGEQVIIDRWIIQGFQNNDGELIINDIEPNFDVDEYKIIYRFIKQNKQQLRPYHSGNL